MGASVDIHQRNHSNIHQKDGASFEFISFLLKRSMLPTPTATSDIVVTNVMLLLRNGVLGSTGPVH